MDRALVEHIRSHQSEYEENILVALEPFVYQKERYKVDYTLAIGATFAEVDLPAFSEMIRKTDKFVVLDEKVCVIIFGFNLPEQGIKAASNMLSKFEMKFFASEIYLGIINSQEEIQAKDQVKKLFETLCYGVQNSMSNTPLDFNAILHDKTM